MGGGYLSTLSSMKHTISREGDSPDVQCMQKGLPKDYLAGDLKGEEEFIR